MRTPGLKLAFLLISTLTAGAAVSAWAAEVGSKASPVEPSKWLNNKGPVSWNDLKGRVILVEKWATW